MTTLNGLRSLPVKFPASRVLLFSIFLSCQPYLQAAQQEPPAPQAPLTTEQETADTALGAPPPETHATQEAPDEFLIMAVHEPGNFIGKTLILDDGTNAVTVGPVLDIRRRTQDQQLYFVVDAQAYFNTAVQYAVAVKDVARMEADKLIIPEAPGMHLKGLDYYPDDYVSPTDAEPPAPVVSEND